MDRRLARIATHKYEVADERNKLNNSATLEVRRLEFWTVDWLPGQSQIIGLTHEKRARGSERTGLVIR